jgi:hypothetical protein
LGAGLSIIGMSGIRCFNFIATQERALGSGSCRSRSRALGVIPVLDSSAGFLGWEQRFVSLAALVPAPFLCAGRSGLSTGFPAWVSTARVVLPPALGSSSQLGFPFKCLIFSASPGILRFAVCRFVLPLGTVQRKNPSAFLLSCLISGVSGFLSAAVSVSVISCN